MWLLRVINTKWHAVERDLLALGYHADDIGTSKLTLWELISIVCAAPPGSAVHHATGSWSKESEMLANLSEQQAGLLSVNGRYERPGVQYQPVTRTSINEKPAFGITMQAMTPEELTAKLKTTRTRADEKPCETAEVEKMRRRLNGDPFDDRPGDWNEN